MGSRELTKARACMEFPSAGGLPPEVWANVRDFMQMEEWAKVSGTCRCMWRLPLSTVNISTSMTPRGVDWAAKRWHSATELVIRGNITSLQALAQKLHQGCTDLANVQSMLVDTCEGNQAYEECPKYMASLFYLLAHLTGLRLVASEIWLRIPADVTWEDVRVDVFEGLHWKASQHDARTTFRLNIADGDTFRSMCPINVTHDRWQ
ncbi:hypothetical protein COCOBI_14-4790 [Coccomyxa sp. Obi]|nr:hypothetical protein COCOBI_14-4790 [Coccomyxa sp. Obi]